MKRLTANRPIQYMGRTYARGDTLPAYDDKMVAAWLKAGSATWEDTAQQTEPDAPEDGAGMDAAAVQALQVLDSLGVKITDDAGAFCGEEELIARITAAVAGEPGEMIHANLDAETLAKLKTDDLEKLAADMGVDIATAKTNTERAQLIAAVEVLIPKCGSAQ